MLGCHVTQKNGHFEGQFFNEGETFSVFCQTSSLLLDLPVISRLTIDEIKKSHLKCFKKSVNLLSVTPHGLKPFFVLKLKLKRKLSIGIVEM